MSGAPADRCKVPQAFWLTIDTIGLSPAALLRQARLPASLHLNGQALVSAAQYFALWRALEALVPEPGVGNSRKSIMQDVTDGARQGRLHGYAMATLIGRELLCVDVEEYGRPRVSVRRLSKPGAAAVPRFHLDEPEIFTTPDA